MTSDPVIEVSNLQKEYNDVRAVDGISFTVREGEVFGFLGPNGAGKSTTIETLLGFTRPTGGTIRVLGKRVTATPAAVRSEVGVVPDECTVYDRLTAVEHVELAAQFKDVAVDPSALLDEVGIDPEDRDRPAGEYSKGMTQRLLLAFALVGDPALLVLDEPSSGLDPAGMVEIRELVKRRAADGTTVFFSSHNLPEVEAVCDRVGILHDGTLTAVDTIESLRDRTGGVGRIEATLAATPEPATLDAVRSVDDVVRVAADEQAVEVVVSATTAKAPAIATLTDRARVLDVTFQETSLEELFDVYTADESARAESPRDRSGDDGQWTGERIDGERSGKRGGSA